MVEEDIQATHKTKEQIRQDAAGLEEAIRLQAQMDEEVTKHIHFDKMLHNFILKKIGIPLGLKLKPRIQISQQGPSGERISNDDLSKRMLEMKIEEEVLMLNKN
ncbi:hypothetical protein Tco_0491604 [Tanacetum coccineum]